MQLQKVLEIKRTSWNSQCDGLFLSENPATTPEQTASNLLLFFHQKQKRETSGVSEREREAGNQVERRILHNIKILKLRIYIVLSFLYLIPVHQPGVSNTSLFHISRGYRTSTSQIRSRKNEATTNFLVNRNYVLTAVRSIVLLPSITNIKYESFYYVVCDLWQK